MKNVIVLLFAFVLITSCGGQKKQANEDVQNVQLKGEEVPIGKLFLFDNWGYSVNVSKK